MGSPVTRMCQHAGSALIAAAADDLVIRMCASLTTTGFGSFALFARVMSLQMHIETDLKLCKRSLHADACRIIS